MTHLWPKRVLKSPKWPFKCHKRVCWLRTGATVWNRGERNDLNWKNNGRVAPPKLMIFRESSKGGFIFNLKNYVSDFGPLNRFFWAWNYKKGALCPWMPFTQVILCSRKHLYKFRNNSFTWDLLLKNVNCLSTSFYFLLKGIANFVLPLKNAFSVLVISSSGLNLILNLIAIVLTLENIAFTGRLRTFTFDCS